MNDFARYSYPRNSTDVALPLGSAEYVLFETGHDAQNPTTQQLGFKRYVGSFWNSQNGTLKVQFWDPVAATYRDVSSTAVALTTTVANQVTTVVAPHERIRVLWVNGGVDQTIFRVNHGFSRDIAAIS